MTHPPRRCRWRRPLPLLVLAGLLSLGSNTAEAQANADTTIAREQLMDGIYLFKVPVDLDKWTATNVVVIVNDDDVTVFDSNTRLSTTRRIIAEIRRLTPKPVRTLINSHWHMDHWSGNDEYVKAWPGLQIVATTETRDYMKRMGSHFFAHGLETSAQRERASLDSAIRSGKRSDGRPLTADARRAIEADIEDTKSFAAEVASIRRVLPTVAFRDSLVLWSGSREFQLVSLTGDATGSTVLFLPRERLLVTGDVLVARSNGMGPPPWTTNSFAITPWYQSLRRMQALGASVIVPGQGNAFRDGRYLATTADLFGAVLDQAHAALEAGAVTTAEVQGRVNVDEIARRYPLGPGGLDADFRGWVNVLVRKVVLESYDGVVR